MVLQPGQIALKTRATVFHGAQLPTEESVHSFWTAVRAIVWQAEDFVSNRLCLSVTPSCWKKQRADSPAICSHRLLLATPKSQNNPRVLGVVRTSAGSLLRTIEKLAGLRGTGGSFGQLASSSPTDSSSSISAGRRPARRPVGLSAGGTANLLDDVTAGTPLMNFLAPGRRASSLRSY